MTWDRMRTSSAIQIPRCTWPELVEDISGLSDIEIPTALTRVTVGWVGAEGNVFVVPGSAKVAADASRLQA
jgi:hypothetical protein